MLKLHYWMKSTKKTDFLNKLMGQKEKKNKTEDGDSRLRGLKEII